MNKVSLFVPFVSVLLNYILRFISVQWLVVIILVIYLENTQVGAALWHTGLIHHIILILISK